MNAQKSVQATSQGGEALQVAVSPRLLLKRLFHGLITYVLARAKGLITLPILTRLLGAGGMGVLALAGATANLTWPLAILGLHTGLSVQMVHLRTESEIARAYGIVLTAAVLSATTGAAALVGLVHQFGDAIGLAGLQPYLLVVFLYTIAVSIKETAIVLPQISQETGFLSGLNLLIDYGATALGVALVLFGHGPGGVLWADTLFLFGGAIWLLVRAVRRYGWPDRLDMGFLRSALVVALPILPVGAGQWALQSLDNFFIARAYGQSAVGVYSVAYTLASVALVVNASLNWVFFPTAASLFRQGQEKFRLFLSRSLRLLTVLVGYMVAGAVLLAPWGVELVAGPAFTDAIPVVPLVVAGYGAWTITHVLQVVPLTVLRRSTSIAWTYVITVGANVLLNILLIGRFALVGAAIATLLSYGIGLVLMGLVDARIVPGLMSWSTQVIALVPAVVLIPLAAIFPSPAGATFWDPVLRVLVLTMAYVALALVVGALQPADRQFLRRERTTAH